MCLNDAIRTCPGCGAGTDEILWNAEVSGVRCYHVDSDGDPSTFCDEDIEESGDGEWSCSACGERWQFEDSWDSRPPEDCDCEECEDAANAPPEIARDLLLLRRADIHAAPPPYLQLAPPEVQRLFVRGAIHAVPVRVERFRELWEAGVTREWPVEWDDATNPERIAPELYESTPLLASEDAT